MKKDAYFFSHDANAQDDHKCMKLIDQLGMEGYGIFWALVERLRNEHDYRLPISVCSIYAKRWNTSKEKVEAVVKGYGLFIIDTDYFYSERLIRSMDYKSQRGKKAASVRWGNASAMQNDASAMQLHSGCNAGAMQNDAKKGEEKKEEDIKGNESIENDTPSIRAVIDLLSWHVKDQKKRITARTLSIEAEKFLDKYKDEPRESFNPRAKKWIKNLYNDPII